MRRASRDGLDTLRFVLEYADARREGRSAEELEAKVLKDWEIDHEADSVGARDAD